MARGEPPSKPESLAVPVLASPLDRAQLRLKPDAQGDARSGSALVAEVRPGDRLHRGGPSPGAGREPLRLETAQASLTVPRLAPGTYRWTVRAVGADALNSQPSAPRRFELAVDPLKLEVREPTWK